MGYSKKAKCQGCAALVQHGNEYVCRLGVVVNFLITSTGEPSQPTPTSKCWKPMDNTTLSGLLRKLKLKGYETKPNHTRNVNKSHKNIKTSRVR